MGVKEGDQSVDHADPKSGADNQDQSTKRTPEELEHRLVEVSAEAKKYRQKASEFGSKLEELTKTIDSLKSEKLKEQGQWKEAHDEIKTKYDQLEADAKKKTAAFAFRVVTSQFAQEAAKAGCAKVDDLIKLATADGIINELEVSQEDFSVSQDSLKAALDKAQKAYPYLYAKPTPAMRDGIPNTQKQAPKNSRDLASMDMRDLVALAKTAQ